MGRTRTFDTDAAVLAARETFWARGFEETSVPDLEAATGLNRSSLYHSFGSKRGLFDAAVRSYLDEVIRPPLVPLMLDDVAPGALQSYLERVAGWAGSAGQGNGCLLLNAAAGGLAHDETMSEGIRAYHAELLAALGRGVRAARPNLDPKAADELAAELTGSVVAALLLVRVDPAAAEQLLRLAARRAEAAAS
ncbi:TetR/AcrR family transcriptional regulator [Galactobacter valiniphilus]|uniref:TetR/AcrR family transcriptional regulator n=2 Tax=Galactobacter valiniphilus TaxID=2676122 RepID=A0A399JA97_9MICC|nr:TetR/AcrR family transcriptional regulator [Galactobacter valiniphilus]